MSEPEWIQNVAKLNLYLPNFYFIAVIRSNELAHNWAGANFAVTDSGSFLSLECTVGLVFIILLFGKPQLWFTFK
jgi:hypothetical protein